MKIGDVRLFADTYPPFLYLGRNLHLILWPPFSLSCLCLFCFCLPYCPGIFSVLGMNLFSDTHICIPHSLSPPLGVLFGVLGCFLSRSFWNCTLHEFLWKNYSITSQFSPRICFLPPCRTAHCLGVLFTALTMGCGAWSLRPLINPIFFPLICNKTVTNFTAWTLWGGPATCPGSREQKGN